MVVNLLDDDQPLRNFKKKGEKLVAPHQPDSKKWWKPQEFSGLDHGVMEWWMDKDVCSPDSVGPMVFIVFFKDSWGIIAHK